MLQSLFEVVHFTTCRLARGHFDRPLLLGNRITELSCIGMCGGHGIEKTEVFVTIQFDSFLCKLNRTLGIAIPLIFTRCHHPGDTTVGCDRARIVTDGSPIICGCSFIITLSQPEIASLDITSCQTIIEFECTIEIGLSQRIFLLQTISFSSARIKTSVLGIESDCLRIVFDGDARFSLSHENFRTVKPRIGIFGMQSNGGGKILGSFVEAATHGVADTAIM